MRAMIRRLICRVKKHDVYAHAEEVTVAGVRMHVYYGLRCKRCGKYVG